MLTGCTAFGGMRAALAILGIGLLAACSGGGGGSGDTGGGPSSMIDDLGTWNSLAPESLDVSDGNDQLRAHYDDSGVGHVTASAPVQPEGTGSATWSGRWSGKVDVNPAPYADIGLNYAGLARADLEELSGDARITAYFESDGVQAELTYEDTGLDGLGLGSITSDRVAVNNGTFTPSKTQSATFPVTGRDGTEVDITMGGEFTGEGVFGGTDAEGVAGYMNGDITFTYLGSENDLGPFRSVFYGTKDSN